MKTYLVALICACITLTNYSCSKENLESQDWAVSQSNFDQKTVAHVNGNTQFSGVGYFADISDCDYGSVDAAFALNLEGDLEGCLFVFVEYSECSPSGTYRQSGTEHFVGTYKGESGSFKTNYRFEGKFEGCKDGSFLGAEIFGRCQHPIVEGSGEGVFENMKGRLNFKDDIETGALPYKGHFMN